MFATLDHFYYRSQKLSQNCDINNVTKQNLQFVLFYRLMEDAVRNIDSANDIVKQVALGSISIKGDLG